MKFAAVALATAILGFLGSSTAHATPVTLVGDTVLFQGCTFAPIFPTDCLGFPNFTQQTTVVTNDASDAFVFGVSTTNVQSNSIIIDLGPGYATGSFFNGILVKGIDWVGSPLEFISGFTLTGNTMGLSTSDVNIFDSGHSVVVNGALLAGRTGAVTINLLTSSAAPTVPEPTTLLLLGSGLAAAGVRQYRLKK